MNHVVIFLTGAVPFPEGSMKHSWYIQHGPLIQFKLQGWGVQCISVGPSLMVEGRCETITLTKIRPSNEVPNLGLGPKWDQSPNLVPKKSQFCMQVPNLGYLRYFWVF